MDTILGLTRDYETALNCLKKCLEGPQKLLKLVQTAFAKMEAESAAKALEEKASFIEKNTAIYGSAEKAARAYDIQCVEAIDRYRQARDSSLAPSEVSCGGGNEINFGASATHYTSSYRK